MNIKAITKPIVNTACKVGFKLQKKAPQILVGSGIALGIGGAIGIGIQSTKLEAVIDEITVLVNEKKARATAQPSKENERELRKAYIYGAWRVTKLYGIPALLLAGSGTCTLVGFHIISSRLATLNGVYMATQAAFESYRQRVSKAIGEDKEQKIFYGLEKQQIETVDENGKKTKSTITTSTVDPKDITPFARYFGESNRFWKKDVEYNKAWLGLQENLCNQMLRARGRLFLNEVYDMLGLPHTKAGQRFGWVYSRDANNPKYVSFGISDVIDPDPKKGILLMFNVQGDILNSLEGGEI